MGKVNIYGLDQPKFKEASKIEVENKKIVATYDSEEDAKKSYDGVNRRFIQMKQNATKNKSIQSIGKKRDKNKIIFSVKNGEIDEKLIKSILDPYKDYIVPVKALISKKSQRLDSIIAEIKKKVSESSEIAVSSRDNEIIIGYFKGSSIEKNSLNLVEKIATCYHFDKDERFVGQRNYSKTTDFKDDENILSRENDFHEKKNEIILNNNNNNNNNNTNSINNDCNYKYSILILVSGEMKKGKAEKKVYFSEYHGNAEKKSFSTSRKNRNPGCVFVSVGFYFSSSPSEKELEKIINFCKKEEVEDLSFNKNHHIFIEKEKKEINSICVKIRKGKKKGVPVDYKVSGLSLEISADLESLSKDQFIEQVDNFISKEGKKKVLRKHKQNTVNLNDIFLFDAEKHVFSYTSFDHCMRIYHRVQAVKNQYALSIYKIENENKIAWCFVKGHQYNENVLEKVKENLNSTREVFEESRVLINFKRPEDARTEMEKKKFKDFIKKNDQNIFKVYRKEKFIVLETKLNSFTKNDIWNVFNENEIKSDEKVYCFENSMDARSFCNSIIQFNGELLPSFSARQKQSKVYLTYVKDGELSEEEKKFLKDLLLKTGGREEKHDEDDSAYLLIDFCQFLLEEQQNSLNVISSDLINNSMFTEKRKLEDSNFVSTNKKQKTDNVIEDDEIEEVQSIRSPSLSFSSGEE